MLEAIAESAAVAWPLALTCATVVAADRVRAGRRRERLNRALHELRRPLQALILEPAPPVATPRPAGTQLELALDALAGLDREINGGVAPPGRRIVEGRVLIEGARARWRAQAELAGRPIAVAWGASRSRVACDPAAIARALDNLIANALEHGSGPIALEGHSRAGRLRLVVIDGGEAGAGERVASTMSLIRARRLRVARAGRRDRRRGHGLLTVAAIAAEHGGRFAACRHRAGASAVLELPLADG
ncbi:MAG: hypothetical protein GEU88_18330 [Solirubrobacterales bacterium]|nr:hypothetical protein [Solirubrobacterales bacterium]